MKRPRFKSAPWSRASTGDSSQHPLPATSRERPHLARARKQSSILPAMGVAREASGAAEARLLHAGDRPIRLKPDPARGTFSRVLSVRSWFPWLRGLRLDRRIDGGRQLEPDFDLVAVEIGGKEVGLARHEFALLFDGAARAADSTCGGITASILRALQVRSRAPDASRDACD